MKAMKDLLYILSGREKRHLAMLVAGSVLLAFLETVSIGLIIPIMNLFLSDGPMSGSSLLARLQGFMGIHDKPQLLAMLIYATMGVFLFKTVYSVLMLRFQYGFSGEIYCRLTERVMTSYLNRPYSFHLDNNSSILFKNMITEVSQFASGFLSPAIIVVSEAMVLVMVLALLVSLYPVMTALLVAVFSAVTILAHFLIKHRVKKYSKDREIYSDSIYVKANEALSGIKEIQTNGSQRYFVDRFTYVTRLYQDSYRKYSVVSNLPRYMLESLLFITMLAILLASLRYRVPAGQLIPMMTVMGAASIKILPSVNKIYLNFNSMLYYANSLGIVHKTLSEDIEAGQALQDAKGDHDLFDKSASRVAFEMKDVAFSYKKDSPGVLRGLSLDIPFGKSVAVVGLSGAGKTTLIDIMTGLLTPSAGSVKYRGIDISKEKIAGLRRKIGYVPQQIFLIDDTIEENIIFGRDRNRQDDSLLKRAIQMADLNGLIETLPDGVRASAGERGVRLSGGQRQRIGIARALYREPEVLILDEATSALDGKTESEVIDSINRMKRSGMAVIIVAHRLSTIANADLIYVLDRGIVAASGTFEELSRNSAIFNDIVNKFSEDKGGSPDGRS